MFETETYEDLECGRLRAAQVKENSDANGHNREHQNN
jgi:hypothetical protein